MNKNYSLRSFFQNGLGLVSFGGEVIKAKYRTARNIRNFVHKYGKKYETIKNYMKIEGWLTEREAITLFNLANDLEHKKNPTAVEIGSWLGKSSFIIAMGLKKISGKASLFCIDPFNSEGDAKSKKGYKKLQNRLFAIKHLTLKEQFIRNMEKNDVIEKVTILEGYSFNCVKKFHKLIDLLFIDGNHEYEAVLQDYNDWNGKIKHGGIIALHDVEFDPQEDPDGTETHIGPGLVVKRKIIGNLLWKDHHQVDGLFYAVKK